MRANSLDLLGLRGGVTVVNGSVEDYGLMERVLTEYEIEAVFHLAAQAIVEAANRSPLSTFEANIRGTYSLLEASRRAETVRRVVVASSDKAYGSHDRLPYDEDYPLLGLFLTTRRKPARTSSRVHTPTRMGLPWPFRASPTSTAPAT